MRLVAGQQTLRYVTDRGGDLYLWPRAHRCCGGVSYTLEAATQPPAQEFRRVHTTQGISVWATPGLIEPDEIHLDLGRRGTLRAFWNGQSWIG